MTNLYIVLEGRDIILQTKICIVKAMVFLVVVYLDRKEIKPVNLKGNKPWIFIERTDAEAEAPILWPPDVKSWSVGKDPDAGKDWG